MKKIRIGCGAGYGGDRYEPAEILVKDGNLDYIVYECMAERTIALYQKDKLKNIELGYNPQLENRLRPVLRNCYEKGIKIITNMGAANPMAALEKVFSIAEEMELNGLKIACVLGDDVVDIIKEYHDNLIIENNKKVGDYINKIISANAYIGIDGIVEALKEGSDIVITGRVADPSLFLAPMIYEFGWDKDDYKLLSKGTVLGHLMECGGQITGGYFADPGYKDVPDLWNLGFPIVEVSEDGEGIISKVEGTGGIISLGTCKEQLLYEIHDPSHYITPDCIADFSEVKLEQIQNNMVKVTGGSGIEKPTQFKVSLGYKDSIIGSGQISYAGKGAIDRALLAKEVLEKRLTFRNIKYNEIKYDLIGLNSLHGNSTESRKEDPYEVRLRVVARCEDRSEAIKIGEEVEALWTNGPYGGGGATKEIKEVIGVVSTLIPRDLLHINVCIKEVN